MALVSKIRSYGFDPGTKFGFSVWDGLDLVASGVWRTLPPTAHTGERFRNARKELIGLITRFPVTRDKRGTVTSFIGYEDVHASVFKSKANLRVYAGLVAQIWEMASVVDIWDIRGVTPSSLKKHATGGGGASKDAMVTACHTRFGVTTETDDEADAIWCGHFCAERPQDTIRTGSPKNKSKKVAKKRPKKGRAK